MIRQPGAGIGPHVQERTARLAEPARGMLHPRWNPAQAAGQHRPDLGAGLHQHQTRMHEHQHALVVGMVGHGDALGRPGVLDAEGRQQDIGDGVVDHDQVGHGWQI